MVENNGLRRGTPIKADSTAYIYRLPNELLHLIFSFLFVLSENVPFPNGADPSFYVNPVVVVRWVCKWFREIASQHPIWLEDSRSDLSDFIPFSSGEFIKSRGKFLETLLDDDDLCSCLRRREDWEFGASADFFAVFNEKKTFPG